MALQLTEARFNDPLMGVNKTVIPVGSTITGASSANYRLGDVSVVPAAILNNSPVFDAFPRLVAVEAKTMQELITARDTDLPQQTLSYRLLEAPNGVTSRWVGFFSGHPNVRMWSVIIRFWWRSVTA